MTTDSDGITFEVDDVATGATGLLEVAGRWYGVRGRRFVRPTLTVTLKDDGGDVRLLAALEHKPWAAEEGDPWRAGFPYQGVPGDIASAELNVAPDITVAIGPPVARSGRGRSTGATPPPSAATGARTPVIRDNPARPRPRAPRTAEVQRLHERLNTSEAAASKERARREAADAALEQERGTARTLQAELGRLRAEAELAATVQSELQTASAQLDHLRGELRKVGAERDHLRGERDVAQRGLAGEQAETARLRSQLTDAEAAVRRLTRAGRDAQTAAAAAGAAVADAPAEAAPASATGQATERVPVPRFADAPSGARGIAERGTHDRGTHDRGSLDRGGSSPSPRRDRPLNPSLRASNWIGRGIALVVLIVVIIALLIVVSSTGH